VPGSAQQGAAVDTVEAVVPRPRSWSDDDLRAAVAGASSIAEVVRRLRLGHGGAAYLTVRTRMEQLGFGLLGDTAARGRTLQIGAGGDGARSVRRWSDEDLARAVASARSLADTFRLLGLRVGGSQWQLVRRRILDLGLATDHWTSPLLVRRPRVTMDDARSALREVDLRALTATHPSRAAVLRAVGLPVTQASYRAIAEALSEQDLELDGRPRGGIPRRPLEEILVVESDWTDTATLRERLIEAGLKERRCERCGIAEWQGQPAQLQLDHSNGDRTDNRRENLRILCANCHALTETWCARNRGRRR
jgi:hypothetical protein